MAGQSDPPDEAVRRFRDAVARGETPRTQPAALVAELFDGLAGRFEKHLVGRLQYRVPDRVADIVLGRHPQRRLDLLDLGCGTGLLGLCLGRLDGDLIGVDLSARMLDQAMPLGIYGELRQGDALAELRATPAGRYDCIAACDVFIYVGDLSALVPAAFRALRPGGALIFSCEEAQAAEGDLRLRASGRYAHSRASVASLCRDAGFAGCTFEDIVLRLEADRPIAGYIATAEKR
ncbi:MAG: methyltransferase domain-containing protein [Proteobacteria bacterium]|uniref:class I SAM-dependent DNA methyltransferase n=1 Tax=Rudaea sp. TaxID=2136325 RepID=UPI00321FB57B|nr:methyltransferase domain-containing protein [Pseudomonadota bacterium]